MSSAIYQLLYKNQNSSCNPELCANEHLPARRSINSSGTLASGSMRSSPRGRVSAPAQRRKRAAERTLRFRPAGNYCTIVKIKLFISRSVASVDLV
jgi:hypothetical protein